MTRLDANGALLLTGGLAVGAGFVESVRPYLHVWTGAGPGSLGWLYLAFAVASFLLVPCGVALVGTAVDLEFRREWPPFAAALLLAGLLGYAVGSVAAWSVSPAGVSYAGGLLGRAASTLVAGLIHGGYAAFGGLAGAGVGSAGHRERKT